MIGGGAPLPLAPVPSRPDLHFRLLLPFLIVRRGLERESEPETGKSREVGDPDQVNAVSDPGQVIAESDLPWRGVDVLKSSIRSGWLALLRGPKTLRSTLRKTVKKSIERTIDLSRRPRLR